MWNNMFGIGHTNRIKKSELEDEHGKRKRPIYALGLNGVSGSVKVNQSSSINDLSTMSIFVKIKPLGLGETSNGRLFEKNNIKILHITVDNRFRFVHRFTGNDGTWITPINSFTFNENSNLVMTYDNTNVDNDPIFYINGNSVLVTESVAPTLVANTDNTVDLYIGNNAADTITFNGPYYEYACFNTILSPTQADNLSTGLSKPNDIAGCVLYHDYTRGHAEDLSGNRNNGTLQGNAQFIIDHYE